MNNFLTIWLPGVIFTILGVVASKYVSEENAPFPLIIESEFNRTLIQDTNVENISKTIKKNNDEIDYIPHDREKIARIETLLDTKDAPIRTASTETEETNSPTLVTVELEKNQLSKNLFDNGDLLIFYKPAWNIYLRDNSYSRIAYNNNSLSLSYSGRGEGVLEISASQIVPITKIDNLIFSTILKISDRNQIGYAVAKLSLMDELENEIFHFAISPDMYYEPIGRYELIYTQLDRKERVFIVLNELLPKLLTKVEIRSIKFIQVSYEITSPIGVSCKRCSIQFFESRLTYK